MPRRCAYAIAARTTPNAMKKAIEVATAIEASGATTASLIGDTVDRPDRAPAFAAGALPVMRLGTETTMTATVHRLPFKQLLREIAQDQEIFARLAFDLIHRGIDQCHQPTHRRTLPQLRGQEFDGRLFAIAFFVKMR